MDQAGMKDQLTQLHALLSFAEPELANYLNLHDSGNMFFCFRWLLVLFKREFTQDDIMRLWEVIWTGLPCKNFHLLLCVAILDTEKHVLIENNYGFTEILKVGTIYIHKTILQVFCFSACERSIIKHRFKRDVEQSGGYISSNHGSDSSE